VCKKSDKTVESDGIELVSTNQVRQNVSDCLLSGNRDGQERDHVRLEEQRNARQTEACVCRKSQEPRTPTRVDFETKVDAPISPTAVKTPSKSGTTSSVLRLAHTSRASRAWRVCGTRESSWDARAPKSRPRAGRTREKRISQDELFPRFTSRTERSGGWRTQQKKVLNHLL